MNIMRKIIVCSLVIIISVCMLYCITSNATSWNDRLHNVTSVDGEGNVVKTTRTVAQSAITVTQVIGVGIAVIMLIVLGMKYMISAPEDKAQIKKHAVVYVIGAVVLFGAVGILEMIKNLAGAADS